MKISKEYPTYFISGDDLLKEEVTVTISEVKKEMVPTKPGKPDEEVIAVYFQDKKRGMRLNKTRAKEIRAITGEDETDNWVGKQIVLFASEQNAFGKDLYVIHCKAVDGGLPQIDEEL